MRINKITIENIKGIDKHEYEFLLEPNKPIFFVAPNGFGKSSFGIAFDSIIASKIELHKNHLHNNKDTNLPKIQINCIDKGNKSVLTADSTKNEINNQFDVFVINSKLVAKAKIADVNGKKIAKPSLEISKTLLINTIPQEFHFDYNPKDEKEKFAPIQKLPNNITELFSNFSLLNEIAEKIDFSKLRQVKKIALLKSLTEEILLQNGTTNKIKKYISDNILNNIQISEINEICNILETYDFQFIKDKVDLLTTALQIISVENRLQANFKKSVKYLEYLTDKAEYEEIIKSINSTRFKIKPIIENRKMFIEWPKAHNISNGQRDILTFITLLVKARKTFKKDNCILIIDEVFDYLDDGNLISFQYYISEFIEKMSSSKNLFPIIMTHLDPKFFNHFCFNDRKMQVCYLQKVNTKTSKEILKIVYNREEPTLKDELDKHYFHYHIDKSSDLSTEFQKHSLNKDWGNCTAFHSKISRELRRYLFENTPYDPIAVCIALRVEIEKLVYEKLKNQVYQDEFINSIHGTRNKLNFCVEKGRKIPEVYYLLGIIYNTSLHLKQGQDIRVPLSIKLDNINIKRMIESVFIPK
ncbi:hypothetical protein [Flavobacterium sp. 14A]|uniref:hypothetical protein n=1 Tax=Flavobacterium sp. 14A TaxID=2735896 RepID=UPI00156D632F|nr:hypothetical protein [Flavobacterium sp. 14A]NRT13657.1 hypothetical protein [Flavobacterium sp. 14A]